MIQHISRQVSLPRSAVFAFDAAVAVSPLAVPGNSGTKTTTPPVGEFARWHFRNCCLSVCLSFTAGWRDVETLTFPVRLQLRTSNDAAFWYGVAAAKGKIPRSIISTPHYPPVTRNTRQHPAVTPVPRSTP
jgi:hypothetical protein